MRDARNLGGAAAGRYRREAGGGASLAIQGVKDKRLAAILAKQAPGKSFPADLIRVAERKLRSLDAATSLDDLRDVRGNRLEALKGDRAGQHSIRVNDQFRLCFVWAEFGPAEVEFVDYH